MSRAFIDGKYPVDEAALARATVCGDRGVRKEALELLCVDGKRSSAPRDGAEAVATRAPGGDARRERGVSQRARDDDPIVAREDQDVPNEGGGRAENGGAPRAKGDDGLGEEGGFRFGFGEDTREPPSAAPSLRWLVRLALASAYPGAPYERKYMALDVLNAVAETCGVGRKCRTSVRRDVSSSTTDRLTT